MKYKVNLVKPFSDILLMITCVLLAGQINFPVYMFYESESVINFLKNSYSNTQKNKF